MRPTFILLSGIMGAGKSSFVSGGTIATLLNNLGYPLLNGLRVLNVDERAKVALEHEYSVPPSYERYEWISAAKDVECLLDWHIQARADIGVETVLTSDKYRSRIAAARANSYRIIGLYLTVDSIDTAKQRVLKREENGGHGAQFDRFESDWTKSHLNASWLAVYSDIFLAFDVSDTGRLGLVGQKRNSTLMYEKNSACVDMVRSFERAQEVINDRHEAYAMNLI